MPPSCVSCQYTDSRPVLLRPTSTFLKHSISEGRTGRGSLNAAAVSRASRARKPARFPPRSIASCEGMLPGLRFHHWTARTQGSSVRPTPKGLRPDRRKVMSCYSADKGAARSFRVHQGAGPLFVPFRLLSTKPSSIAHHSTSLHGPHPPRPQKSPQPWKLYATGTPDTDNRSIHARINYIYVAPPSQESAQLGIPARNVPGWGARNGNRENVYGYLAGNRFPPNWGGVFSRGNGCRHSKNPTRSQNCFHV